jgi:outer membrane protein TolC
LAETARRRQVLIEARAREISRRLELLSLVSPGEPDADPDPSSALETEPLPEENPTERLALADRLRPELAEARLRLEQGRLETVYTRNGVMPRLDFFANLAKTGFGERRSASADNWGDDTYEWQAGLRLLHELGEGSAKAEAREADLRYEQSKAALDNLASLIGMEVRQALAELTRAHQQIGASAETRRLQEQTLQAEKERQEVGSSTSLLVAQAQRDLLSSQIAEQEALVAYRLALTRLWLAEGSLLERRGITVK